MRRVKLDKYKPRGPAREKVIMECPDCPFNYAGNCWILNREIMTALTDFPLDCPLRDGDIVIRATRNHGRPRPIETPRKTKGLQEIIRDVRKND